MQLASRSNHASRSAVLALQQTGRRRELRAALRRQRGRALRSLWIAFGSLLGEVMQPLLLSALYLTVFVPFGVLARSARARVGWQPPRRLATAVAALRTAG